VLHHDVVASRVLQKFYVRTELTQLSRQSPGNFQTGVLIAGVTIPVNTTTSPTFTLYNPLGSGVTLELISLDVGWPAAATTAPGRSSSSSGAGAGGGGGGELDQGAVDEPPHARLRQVPVERRVLIKVQCGYEHVTQWHEDAHSSQQP
jgi:hypothetical protein